MTTTVQPELKVLYVIDSLGRGGTERSLAELVPSLGRCGINPVVAVLKRHALGLEDALRAQGIDVHVIPERGLVARTRSLRRLISSERPDVIHTALFRSNMIGRLAGTGQRAAVISSLVNTPYAEVRLRDPHMNRRWTRAAQMTDRWTSRYLTDHFHAVSCAARDAAIIDLGIPPERITVVERGRDTLRLGRPSAERRRQARLRLDLTEDRMVLASVGRGDYQKGHRYLLQAVRHLVDAHPRLVLLVAGRRGLDSAELDQICAANRLQDNVRWLGHREDVPEILAAADQFVFPSLYEGLPGAVIEAMALGLPVVASNIASLREMVEPGRNALLVEPASGAVLAEAIDSLARDRGRMLEYGRRSRAIFEERFTLERSVSRMVALYRQVVGRRQWRPVVLTKQAPLTSPNR